MKYSKFKDQKKAEQLIEEGDIALERNNIYALNQIVTKLYAIVVKDDNDTDLFKSESTGIQ